MSPLRRMKSDGLVVRIRPEIWGALTVLAGTIAAFLVLAIIRP
ncbi:MAG: hypothetical protein WB985_04185 [Candidatus Acidiferrales bacterium]